MLVASPPPPSGCDVVPPPPRYKVLSLFQSFIFIVSFVSLMSSWLGTGAVRADVLSKKKIKQLSPLNF